jgi:hypothetical protein
MTRKLGPLFDAQANMEAWIEAGEEIDWQWAEEEALKASHALRGTPDLLSFWRDAIRKEYEAFEAASAGWPGGSTISVRALPSGDPDEDRKRHAQSELNVAAILARRLTMLIFSALNGDEKIQALKESVPLLRKHLDRLSAIAHERAPKA